MRPGTLLPNPLAVAMKRRMEVHFDGEGSLVTSYPVGYSLLP